MRCYVFLVMSFHSRDIPINNNIVTKLHSVWFLDGRTSTCLRGTQKTTTVYKHTKLYVVKIAILEYKY